MQSLTKQQLVKALTEYYSEQAEAPDDFAEYGDPAVDAQNAAEYIFEIVAQQSQGV